MDSGEAGAGELKLDVCVFFAGVEFLLGVFKIAFAWVAVSSKTSSNEGKHVKKLMFGSSMYRASPGY